MLEEPSNVLHSHRIQRPAHRLDQGLAGSYSCPPQQPLHLRECLLDGVSMRRHILSRANVVASGNSVNGVPYALRFHPHSFRAYQGGSVLVGIRPGRRCYLRFGLSHRALTIPHLAVAGTKRKIPDFRSPFSTYPVRRYYRRSYRDPPSGNFAFAAASVVERLVDLPANP